LGYVDTLVEVEEAVVVAVVEVEEAVVLAVGCTGVISTGARSASSTDETLGGRRDIGIGTGMTVDLGLIFFGAGGATLAVEAVEVVTGVEGKMLVIVIGASELETPLLMATN
jgi:hypothetical protein